MKDEKGYGSPPRAVSTGRLWIGWGAMVGAIVLYGIIGAVIVLRRPAPVTPVLPTWIFSALAVGAGVAALALWGRIRASSEAGAQRGAASGAAPQAPAPAAALTGSVVVWALDEAVAVIGLVAVLTGAPLSTFAICLLAALGLLVLHRPGAGLGA